MAVARKKSGVDASDPSFNLNEEDILGAMEENDDEEEEQEVEADEEGEEEEEETEGEGEVEGEEGEGEGEGEGATEVRVKADKKGNLIDPKTGKIVAAAGPARRFYEDLSNTKARLFGVLDQNKKFRGAMTQAAQAVTALTAENKTLKENKGVPEQLGLSPAEATEFLAVAAKFKDNNTAVDAIKYMLTKAVQRGINLDALGKGAGANIDLNVFAKDITDKVEALVKPLSDRFTQNEQQQQQFTQEQAAVRAEIGDLIAREPAAQPHLKVLGGMLRQPEFAHVKSLNEAWLILKDYLRRQQRERPGAVRGQQRPMGRSKPGTQVSGDIDDSPMSVDTEYREIVRAVMNEYGGID